MQMHVFAIQDIKYRHILYAYYKKDKGTALAGLTTTKCNQFVVNAARHVLELVSLVSNLEILIKK